LTKHISQLTYC